MLSRLWILPTLLVSTSIAYGAASPEAAASASPDEVVQWNKTLLTIVRTPGAQPATVHATHSFALLHSAIYDAVNSIDGTHAPYLVHIEHLSAHTSQVAAAASAAHDVLVALYPTFQTTLDAQLVQSLSLIPDSADKTAGVDVGKAVAQAVLVLRANDGSAATPIPYVFGTTPGAYQSTPPNFPKQPVFTHWPFVTPFALEHANQFRLGPPPALTSPAYTAAFNEVKSLGIVNSTTATPEQMEIGKFWGGAIQNYWNEITQTEVAAHHLTTAQSARVFALLNITLADEVIAFYDTKYTFNLWRPVTAIRAADTDGNPQTIADPNWLPLAGNTAADPSYPGAHATISAGGAFVLDSVFGRRPIQLSVTSEVQPGVVRTFNSFDAAEKEASDSRIFAGQHFRTDEDAGARLGRSVADFVTDHLLTRVHDRDDEHEHGDHGDDGEDDR